MTRIFACLLFALFSSSFLSAQNEYNDLENIADGLHFMYFEKSGSKAVVVEFADHLALIETPICDEGGGAKNLRDHSEGGEKVLRTLRHRFPAKPLRYLLHSHWHPHSISSLNPFLVAGVQVFSTKSNFKVVKTFADSLILAKNAQNIRLIETDSFRIGDATNSIVMHRFVQKDYPATPTAEYLYFELPRYQYLHCGCMFTKWEGEYFQGKEIRTGRAEDLHRLIQSRGIAAKQLIRLRVEAEDRRATQPFSSLDNIVRHGIGLEEVSAQYSSLPDAVLLAQTDSLIAEAIKSRVPTSIFNTLAYAELGKKSYQRALAFAKVQTILKPSDPNAWDTLGEVYWYLGEKEIARHFERQAKKISPDFSGGGEAVWQQNLEAARKI